MCGEVRVRDWPSFQGVLWKRKTRSWNFPQEQTSAGNEEKFTRCAGQQTQGPGERAVQLRAEASISPDTGALVGCTAPLGTVSRGHVF
jgi:hypothetical protein